MQGTVSIHLVIALYGSDMPKRGVVKTSHKLELFRSTSSRSNTNGGKKADTDQGLYWQYSLDMGASQTTNVHYLSENDFAARTSPDVAYPSGATPSPGPF